MMYLIYGDSFRLIQEEIAKIIKDDVNVVTFDLATSTLEDVLTEATYVSMFEEKKYIIVKNALFFTSAKSKEEDLELLFRYLEHPVSLTTIIFTTYEKIDARKKITKSFSEKYKVISVSNLTLNDLTNKVRELITNAKYKIDAETILYIIKCCHNNYDFIYNEIQKIFLYYEKPQMIQMDDVKNIVARSLVDNNFKFVEAVVEKNIKNALIILEDLFTLKVDPIALMMLLAREYRLIYSVLTLMELGYSKSSICKELGLHDWQVEKLARSASQYYKDDLVLYLKKLADVDYNIKSGDTDKFLALKIFLLELF